MAKKKIGRALAGLAALGTMGALAARKSSRANEERMRSMSPAPPAPMRKREPLRELQDEIELRIQEDRMARGVPAVTDEEQAEMFKGIPGVRSGTGVPIRSGDGLLQTESFKKGGAVKSRSSVSNASRRGDGIAIRGKTKGRML